MRGDDMAQAHRADYAHHDLCQEAARALRKVLESPRVAKRQPLWRAPLVEAAALLDDEAAHVVAVWD